jgi:multisubunit Na+/H+ antiporter MnhB subunit
MAEIITQMEYILAGAVIVAVASVLLYTVFSKLYSTFFSKHYLIFLDSEGKVKEIVTKTLRKGKTTVKHKKNEYCIDPVNKYHIMAYDEKNELKIKKDGTIDSLIKAKTVEEYELAAFSMLSRLLQSRIRAVDMVMLLLMGVVAALIVYHFAMGGK